MSWFNSGDICGICQESFGCTTPVLGFTLNVHATDSTSGSGVQTATYLFQQRHKTMHDRRFLLYSLWGEKTGVQMLPTVRLKAKTLLRLTDLQFKLHWAMISVMVKKETTVFLNESVVVTIPVLPIRHSMNEPTFVSLKCFCTLRQGK